MIVFVLEQPEQALANATADSVRAWSGADVRIVRPPFAGNMNAHLAGCMEPFFVTLRAGDQACPSFVAQVSQWLEQMGTADAGIAAICPYCVPGTGEAVRSPCCLHCAGEVAVWRTEAVCRSEGRDKDVRTMRGGFPDYDWQPFDTLLLADKRQQLESEGWTFCRMRLDEAIVSRSEQRLRQRAARTRRSDIDFGGEPLMGREPIGSGFLQRKLASDAASWLQPLLYYPNAKAASSNQKQLAPLVSIALCVHNDRDYLPWAIRSVLAQERGDWELLIVDDGSRTPLNLWEDGWEADERLQLLRHSSNCGKAAALNTALACARGEWLLELDADDWLAPGALPALLTSAERASAETVLISGDYAEWSESRSRRLFYRGVRRCGEIPNLDRRIVEGVPLAPRMCRISEVRASGGWGVEEHSDVRLYEDMGLLDKLGARGELHYIPKVLYHRRLRAGSVTRSGDYARWLQGRRG